MLLKEVYIFLIVILFITNILPKEFEGYEKSLPALKTNPEIMADDYFYNNGNESGVAAFNPLLEHIIFSSFIYQDRSKIAWIINTVEAAKRARGNWTSQIKAEIISIRTDAIDIIDQSTGIYFLVVEN